MATRPRPSRAVGVPGWMLSPHSPLRQPNRERLLAAGIVTTGPIHSLCPWNLSYQAGVAQQPVPLPAKYIRATSAVGPPPSCASWTPLLSTLPVRSQVTAAAGAELKQAGQLRQSGGMADRRADVSRPLAPYYDRFLCAFSL